MIPLLITAQILSGIIGLALIFWGEHKLNVADERGFVLQRVGWCLLIVFAALSASYCIFYGGGV